jgi:hypothetical protein
MPIPTCSAASIRCIRAPRWCRHALGIAAFAALAGGSPISALADICKYADGDGNIHYSNVAPERNWRKLSCTSGDDGTQRKANAAPVGASVRSTPTPAGFPRVDVETQKGRDDVRRKVLSDELDAEEKLLVEARSAYSDGAPVPLPEERASAEKYRERISRLHQAVNVHEKNVEALKKELQSVR